MNHCLPLLFSGLYQVENAFSRLPLFLPPPCVPPMHRACAWFLEMCRCEARRCLRGRGRTTAASGPDCHESDVETSMCWVSVMMKTSFYCIYGAKPPARG